jgi:hypothetical protein
MLALMPLLSEERTALVPKTPSPLVAREPTAIMKRRTYLPNQEPKVFACPSGEIGSAVVVHDSFVLPMQPFLARHFRRSTFLRAVFAPEVIAAERPDLVIEEMVERVLSRPGFFPRASLRRSTPRTGRSESRVERSRIRDRAPASRRPRRHGRRARSPLWLRHQRGSSSSSQTFAVVDEH